MDSAKAETAMLVENWKIRTEGGQPINPAYEERRRDFITIPKVEGYLICYIQKATIILMLMAVADHRDDRSVGEEADWPTGEQDMGQWLRRTTAQDHGELRIEG